MEMQVQSNLTTAETVFRQRCMTHRRMPEWLCAFQLCFQPLDLPKSGTVSVPSCTAVRLNQAARQKLCTPDDADTHSPRFYVKCFLKNRITPVSTRSQPGPHTKYQGFQCLETEYDPAPLPVCAPSQIGPFMIPGSAFRHPPESGSALYRRSAWPGSWHPDPCFLLSQSSSAWKAAQDRYPA